MGEDETGQAGAGTGAGADIGRPEKVMTVLCEGDWSAQADQSGKCTDRQLPQTVLCPQTRKEGKVEVMAAPAVPFQQEVSRLNHPE